MTAVTERLRELLGRSNASVVVEWHDNEWRHGGKHHVTDELSALLDVAEAAQELEKTLAEFPDDDTGIKEIALDELKSALDHLQEAQNDNRR